VHIQRLLQYLTRFERQDLPGAYFHFTARLRIPPFPSLLIPYDEIAEPRYLDRIPLGELLLHDLEDGFHDFGGVPLGKSQLFGDVLDDV